MMADSALMMCRDDTEYRQCEAMRLDLGAPEKPPSINLVALGAEHRHDDN
jgi:hypothetical protein